MTITNCPKCGSFNITTAGTCANCGWSQFAQVTVSTRIVGDCNTRPIEDALQARIAELEQALNIDVDLTIAGLRKELSDAQTRIAELSQALGLITTLKPTMVMDVDHPLDMAKEVEAYVTARITELEATIDKLIEAGDEMSDDSYWIESKWLALVKNWKEREE